MAILVKTDNTSVLIDNKTNPGLFEGDGMTLEAMQKLVGGDIQIIYLNHGVEVNGVLYTSMGMNEEGKFSGLKFNSTATIVAQEHSSIAIGDVIVGEAILFEQKELV